jgi:hypothetical protein
MMMSSPKTRTTSWTMRTFEQVMAYRSKAIEATTMLRVARVESMAVDRVWKTDWGCKSRRDESW